jgi:RNA polymerase sigma factor for flagellar operon FliA
VRGIEIYQKNKQEEASFPSEEEALALVVKIAKYYKRKLPSHIELDDLIQSGYLGLLEAKQHFKPDQGASFDTFAANRIKGAMIDDLRKNSWGTREAMRQMRLFGEAAHRIEQRDQQAATPDAIAKELNMTPEEHLQASQKIALCQVISMTILEDMNALPGNEENPERLVEDDDLADKIKRAIALLPQREKILLSLYYVEELTFKEIAEVLELTEARVCQLHATAISRVRTRLSSNVPLPAPSPACV